MKTTVTILLMVMIMTISVSCSKADNPTTISPSEDQSFQNEQPVSESNGTYTPGILGAWEVELNIDGLTAEVIPARNAAAIGSIFDADLLQFLTVSPCSNCLMISGMRFVGPDKISLDIWMKHPFSDITKRPDLHGFDVRAIFIGSQTGFYYNNSISMMKPNGDQPLAELNPYFILNADGFTSHFDEVVSDPRYFFHGEDVPGNLNPYLRFFESYSTGAFDPHAPHGYNVMGVGSADYLRTAVIGLYSLYGTSRFYIVADVAYGQSATLANRANPQYYLPFFNRTEPWRVEYWIENNNLSINNPSSTAEVVVQVFDWQHAATVDPLYPNPANLSGIGQSSKVTQVELNASLFQDAPLQTSTVESGDGSPSNPLRYRFTIQNQHTNDTNAMPVLIAVRDELHGDAAPFGRLPIPATPAGFPYDTLDIRDYSYYGILWVNVPDSTQGDQEYDNELLVDGESQFASSLYASVDATFFMDPSHKKFQYSWDYNYDGVTFDVDGSGLPSPGVNLIGPGIQNWGLRVRTNSVPPQEYIYKVPVYGYGNAFATKYYDGGGTDYLMSSMGSNSIALTKDRSYYSFVQTDGSGWSIAVGYSDNNGMSAITYIPSGGSGVYSYDQSIAVVESGSDAGVYVVFLRNNEVFFWRTSLDLTQGITPIQVTNMSGSGMVVRPSLVYNNGRLLSYYQAIFFGSGHSRIWTSYSDNQGTNWIDYGAVDYASNYQFNPSAAYDKQNGYTHIAFEDIRNSLTNGMDIYVAVERDGDGLVFDYDLNLSFNREAIDELSPSIAAYGGQVGVVYLEQPPATNENNLYMIVSSSSFRSYESYFISQGEGYSFKHSPPSIAMGYRDRFTVAYGRFDLNTSELISRIDDFTAQSAGSFSYQNLEQRYLGTVNISMADARSAVTAYAGADGYTIVTLAGHQTYEDGSSMETNPFTAFFGKVVYQEDINYGKQ